MRVGAGAGRRPDGRRGAGPGPVRRDRGRPRCRGRRWRHGVRDTPDVGRGQVVPPTPWPAHATALVWPAAPRATQNGGRRRVWLDPTHWLLPSGQTAVASLPTMETAARGTEPERKGARP